jgi:tetratricopeptide (TPR) repeat protein
MAAGEADTAADLLAALITADPSQLEAYQLLGSIYAAQGKTGEAIAQYEQLSTRAPGAATGARTMIGMLKEAQNDRAGARAIYEHVVRADTKAAVAANNLAWIYAEEGKLDEALRLATTARDLMSKRPEPEDTLGWIYLKKGLPSQALAAFEQARGRAPERAVYHYHAGLAYAATGAKAHARAAFTKALSLEPNFPSAADARKQLAGLSAGI